MYAAIRQNPPRGMRRVGLLEKDRMCSHLILGLGETPHCSESQFGMQGLREITQENDSLLCFDEVMTGFR